MLERINDNLGRVRDNVGVEMKIRDHFKIMFKNLNFSQDKDNNSGIRTIVPRLAKVKNKRNLLALDVESILEPALLRPRYVMYVERIRIIGTCDDESTILPTERESSIVGYNGERKLNEKIKSIVRN
ncbi:hypothetical protein Fot_38389 [Forsythia ovata]|uniref:Uncharacterized protein n=1 Tax=Forsythia ovata TaxID=205694 RepID=A0ABD1S4A1_9LAMI